MDHLYNTAVFGTYACILYLCWGVYRGYHRRLCVSLRIHGWDWSNQMRLAIILGFSLAVGMNVATWGSAEWFALCAASTVVPSGVESACLYARGAADDIAYLIRPVAHFLLVPAGLLFIAATYADPREVRRDIWACAGLMLGFWVLAFILLL